MLRNKTCCRNSRREELVLLDRKSSMLTTELHDVRVQSEISEKARRAAEAEVRQASEIISQLTATNSTLSVSHKKLATEHQQLTVNITFILAKTLGNMQADRHYVQRKYLIHLDLEHLCSGKLSR